MIIQYIRISAIGTALFSVEVSSLFFKRSDSFSDQPINDIEDCCIHYDFDKKFR